MAPIAGQFRQFGAVYGKPEDSGRFLAIGDFKVVYRGDL